MKEYCVCIILKIQQITGHATTQSRIFLNDNRHETKSTTISLSASKPTHMWLSSYPKPITTTNTQPQ